MKIQFTKAQTNGNDFVMIEDTKLEVELIKKILDRKYGVGGDQLILYKNLNYCEVKIFNSDGSTANMCGNGLCALTKYFNKDTFYLVGKKQCKGNVNTNTGFISVELPIPVEIYKGKNYKIIDTGNKHKIYKEPYTKDYNLDDEYNIHIVDIKDEVMYIDSYERGTGHTLACGSGAVAAAFAYGKNVTRIKHPGGWAQVTCTKKNAVLTTKPCIVFEGYLCF